ncbi:hypothetical protein N7517_008176 [Penicillium concentricum]|uniref:HTH CENPB-type domain-containing protein n=1 Tax=Penicillium concentricum TaxID=293559 RepID=A0A9W9V3M1_9EURO|nr:uncharacterized protein N7517_008176 [Penicillium concentricum]KAJ5365290.1 hypothetical protein N7517_008176 [Penicillium concentricum]
MSDQIKKTEERIQAALEAFHATTKPNIAKLAREFDVPYHQLRGRTRGRQSNSDRAKATKTLNSIQEKVLITWVESLDNAYISPTPELVEKSANRLLKNAGSDQVVGHNWAYRFLHKGYPLGSNILSENLRKKQGLIARTLALYSFEEHQFLPHEIYNWDETGYRIGGKPRKVITSRTTNDIATGGQSESITGIECIAADGWVMLPWFLPKGSLHMAEWYENITTPDFRIKPTPSGYSDDEKALQWLFSFHEATVSRVQKGRPRLLLMDNHRVNKLNSKLLDDVGKLENLSQDFKRHIQRSMQANTFLSQQLDLVKESLKNSQFHKSAANQPKNGKSLLGTRGSALSPICANRMMVKRQDAEAKKLIRLQTRQAKALEAQSQAQLARDLAEAEHEASMAARDSSGGNWYIDTTGGYL